MDSCSFRQHLRSEDSPFAVRRGTSTVKWSDKEIHRLQFQRDGELYALMAISPDLQPTQRTRMLYQFLRSPRGELSPDVRSTLDRAARLLSATLPADDVLTVFLALRRERINRKHTSRFVLRYILNHPCLEDLAQRRRPTIVDCIEHAVGRNVARGCIKRLEAEDNHDPYVVRNLLRHATDKDRAAATLRFLYGQVAPQALTITSSYADHHQQFEVPAAVADDRPKTVTATNRGDIAATLVHLYRGGDSAELMEAVEAYADQVAADMPRFEGVVSLVLDVSASTQGYGEREFCCASQSVALRLVMDRCCSNLHVHQVGGAGNPPRPAGATDLSSAVLDALSDKPDVVAVVSDGYENVFSGDLSRVVASLPAAGVETPVVFCHSKFTDKDALELRRPAPELPEVEFWHVSDFHSVLVSIFSAARGDAGRGFTRDYYLDSLSQREKEVATWTDVN